VIRYLEVEREYCSLSANAVRHEYINVRVVVLKLYAFKTSVLDGGDNFMLEPPKKNLSSDQTGRSVVPRSSLDVARKIISACRQYDAGPAARNPPLCRLAAG
jgi:hypothetical protein